MSNPIKDQKTTDDGKVIETTKHPDGRRDVRVHVPVLDVNPRDPKTAKAKEHIETQVFKKLAKHKVLMVVIHKPTNAHAEIITTVDKVREYAEMFTKKYSDDLAKTKGHVATRDEFIIVEHHLVDNRVMLTTL